MITPAEAATVFCTIEYADWAHAHAPSLSQLNAIAARGSEPEITWEPWNALIGPRHAQPRYALRNITAGRFDPYIRTWARSLSRRSVA